MTTRKFRSEALRNKYGVTLCREPLPYFICFSGAEKFPVIVSAVFTLWFFRVKTKEQESIVWKKYHKTILLVVDSSQRLPTLFSSQAAQIDCSDLVAQISADLYSPFS